MEYIENDFAQIEHINQIIANNLNHESWDCFDTSQLLRQYPQLGYYNSTNPELSYINIPDNVKNIRGESVSSHNAIRYNSFIIDIEKIKLNGIEYYRYTFEVRNSLWTGLYKLTKTTKNADGEYETFSEDDYVVEKVGENEISAKSGNTIILTVKGNDRNKLRMCFHMNMAGAERNIKVTNLQLILESGNHYEHQYDTVNTEEAKVTLNKEGFVSNVTVTLTPCDKGGQEIQYIEGVTGAWIPPQKIEDISGTFDVEYGATSVPGEYYCIMKASSNPDDPVNAKTAEKIIRVDKVQNESVSVSWGDDDLYKNIWKGCKHKYRIYFDIKNKYGIKTENSAKLADKVVNITFIHMGGKRIPYSTTITEDPETHECYAEVTISYRGYYDEYSYLEVELQETDLNFGRVMDIRLIKHPWFIASSYTDIVGELYLLDSNGNYIKEGGQLIPNDMGTDWIFVENKNYCVDRTLEINRDITIASVYGKDRSVFNASSKRIIFKTAPEEPNASNLMKVNLIGLTFQNGVGAIYSGAGTRLLIDRCFFTKNSNSPYHHKGCSIYIPDTDYSRKNHSLWKTEIRNSYFKNNKGNEIQSVGQTRINNNLFVTTDSEYLQQPEVKVVSVRAGKVEYTNNKSYINTGTKAMKSNHSYAKALAYVERGATFNGNGPNQLGRDNTLPLYGKYNNQAYTYSIYYYPYSKVKTEIVCSPRKGHERQATGHSSSFKNWVFYDGYSFVRWNKGRNIGNRHNPWTEQELAIPYDLGIFNKINEKFIEDYDPRFSRNKSNTSKYD